MTSPYWTTRLAEASEADAILRLIRAVHGREHLEINADYLHWRYLNNTPFRADLVIAEHEGQPIGMQPVAFFDFCQGQTRLPGAMYTGVLTHPDHRRRGVFSSLIKASNEHAARRGAVFCMTMPNNASLPGFRKFGDWIAPGPIPTFFKVINGRAMLRDRFGPAAAALLGWLPPLLCRPRPAKAGMFDLTVEPADCLDREFDEMAERAASENHGTMLRRSAEYWTWRYLRRPASTYRPTTRVAPAYQTLLARKGRTLVGGVAVSAARQAGFEVGMIVDLLACGEEATIRCLIRAAQDELQKRGAGLVACQATHPRLQSALRAEGFFCPKPERLPRYFHFVYHLTGVGEAEVPRDLGGWYLTFGDSDNT